MNEMLTGDTCNKEQFTRLFDEREVTKFLRAWLENIRTSFEINIIS